MQGRDKNNAGGDPRPPIDRVTTPKDDNEELGIGCVHGLTGDCRQIKHST